MGSSLGHFVEGEQTAGERVASAQEAVWQEAAEAAAQEAVRQEAVGQEKFGPLLSPLEDQVKGCLYSFSAVAEQTSVRLKGLGQCCASSLLHQTRHSSGLLPVEGKHALVDKEGIAACLGSQPSDLVTALDSWSEAGAGSQLCRHACCDGAFVVQNLLP